MKKKLVLAAAFLAVAAAVALPAAANADDYTGSVNSNTGAPGSTIVYNADTGEDSQTGTAELNGPETGGSITPAVLSAGPTTFTTSASGHVTLNVKLPATATNGQVYTLTVNVGAFSDTQTITAAVAATSGSLSFTGFDAMPYFWFGGGLVLLGIGVVVVLTIVRRSRKSPLGV